MIKSIKQTKIVVPLLLFVLNLIQGQQRDITLTFTTSKPKTGDLYIAIYDSAEQFLKTPFKNSKIAYTGKNGTMTVKGLDENKTIAIVAYLDENYNGKLDTNFLGIPSEPCGASRNAIGKFGPPNFKDAAIIVKENDSLTINLK